MSSHHRKGKCVARSSKKHHVHKAESSPWDHYVDPHNLDESASNIDQEVPETTFGRVTSPPTSDSGYGTANTEYGFDTPDEVEVWDRHIDEDPEDTTISDPGVDANQFPGYHRPQNDIQGYGIHPSTNGVEYDAISNIGYNDYQPHDMTHGQDDVYSLGEFDSVPPDISYKDLPSRTSKKGKGPQLHDTAEYSDSVAIRYSAYPAEDYGATDGEIDQICYEFDNTTLDTNRVAPTMPTRCSKEKRSRTRSAAVPIPSQSQSPHFPRHSSSKKKINREYGPKYPGASTLTEAAAEQTQPPRLRYEKIRAQALVWTRAKKANTSGWDDVQTAGEEAATFNSIFASRPWNWEIGITHISGHGSDATEQLRKLTDKSRSNDLLVFYYVGHGRKNPRTSAFEVGNRDTWISWKTFRQIFEAARSDVLVILNCCRAAGAFTPPRSTRELSRGKIMCTIAACNEKQEMGDKAFGRLLQLALSDLTDQIIENPDIRIPVMNLVDTLRYWAPRIETWPKDTSEKYDDMEDEFVEMPKPLVEFKGDTNREMALHAAPQNEDTTWGMGESGDYYHENGDEYFR